MTTNNFRGVPWMVAGATHAAELGRGIAHAASGGGSGISVPGDLKVTAKAVPSTKVDIGPGSCFIPVRAAGVRAQSYLAQQDTASELDGPAAVNGARSYLVLVAVKDPQYPGGVIYDPINEPTKVKQGPYVFPELYGPVPAGTTDVRQISALDGRAVYAPARIDVPANQTTIQPGYIVDLRRLVQPRSHTEIIDKATVNWFNAVDLETWKTWPDLGFQVFAPEWATHVSLKLDLSGILRSGGSIGAALRAKISGPGGFLAYGNDLIVEYDAGPGAAAEAREAFALSMSNVALPASARGAFLSLGSEGRRLFVNEYPGYLREAGGGQVAGTVVFTEKAV